MVTVAVEIETSSPPPSPSPSSSLPPPSQFSSLNKEKETTNGEVPTHRTETVSLTNINHIHPTLQPITSLTHNGAPLQLTTSDSSHRERNPSAGSKESVSYLEKRERERENVTELLVIMFLRSPHQEKSKLLE